MKCPKLDSKTLLLTCALALAAPGCKNDKPEAQPMGKTVSETRTRVKETGITVRVESRVESKREEEHKPQKPSRPEETKSVRFPSGETLPLVEWGDSENYRGCENLSLPRDIEKIREKCYFYNPLDNVRLVRIEGYENTQLSAHFQVWEFAKIDPNDITAGNVDPRYYYKYEAPDPLEPSGKRVLYLYKVARVDPKLVELLEEVRSKFGYPLCPDETYRAYVHNYKTGAAPESAHLSGSGMDINLDRTVALLRKKCGDSLQGACEIRGKIGIADHITALAERAMKKRKGGGVGRYPNILHLDVRGKRAGDNIRRWTRY